MYSCLVIRRFQIIFAIEEFKINLGNSSDMARILDFTVYKSLSTSPFDL